MKFDRKEKPTWCPGCGNFGIQQSLKQAFTELKLEPHNIVMCSGIGCSSNTPHWINVYGFHTIHGRGLTVATGVHLSNTDLTVIVDAGDGDTLAIGSAHFLHAAKRNMNITLLIHNNQIYGLTKGQTSPTSERGFVTKSTPHGNIEDPVNIIELSIAAGATFVARSYSGNVKHLTKTIKQAITHKGFSVIDVLQPCITLNKVNTYQYFQKRVYDINNTNYKTNDKHLAYKKCQEWGNKIPLGVFYQTKKLTYADQLPQISKKPLVKQDISNVNIDKIINSLK
ncbi:MAG: 2-oxoacid:ferredoxin oxidoreductase subunit beta [archaeon]